MATAKKLVVVAGHHRGGTSAAAGALVRMGFYAGADDRLMPPSADNPKGYFEYLPLVAEHERLLTGLDRSWEDNRPLPANWTTSIPAATARKRIGEHLRRLTREAGDAPIVIKDPRIVRFLPIYRTVAFECDLWLRALVVDRPLRAVADSLIRRDGWDLNRAWSFVCQQEGYLREWLAHGVPVSFPDFLAPPFLQFVGAVRRLTNGPVEYDARRLADFFDAELVHHAG